MSAAKKQPAWRKFEAQVRSEHPTWPQHYVVAESQLRAMRLLEATEATGSALDLDAQAVARGGEVDGIEPRAAADAPQRHDAGSGLGDLAAGRADVGDGVGGEGGHGEAGST